MNENQSPITPAYPAREHIDVRVRPSDWIDDELRTAGTEARHARDNIYTDLNNLYKAAPYVKLLGGFASRLSSRQMEEDVVRGNVTGDRALPLRGQSLYGGMLLGVHAELRPARLPFRRAMLSTASPTLLFDIERSYTQSAAGLARLPSDTRLALWSAASKLFEDLPDGQAGRHRIDFLRGYVVTASTVDMARRYGVIRGGSTPF